MSSTTTRRQTTVKVNGKRIRLVTQNGKTVSTPAAPLEWELQAAAVSALRGMPEYVDSPSHAVPGTFTLAGDFNAARRSMREAAKAKATGLTPGEHDIRIYAAGGRLGLIELKGEAAVSAAQKKRHALLAALGFERQAILRAATTADAASQAVTLVRAWLTANNNSLPIAA